MDPLEIKKKNTDNEYIKEDELLLKLFPKTGTNVTTKFYEGNYRDLFSYRIVGNKIYVKRIDTDINGNNSTDWGLNLRIPIKKYI